MKYKPEFDGGNSFGMTCKSVFQTIIGFFNFQARRGLVTVFVLHLTLLSFNTCKLFLQLSMRFYLINLKTFTKLIFFHFLFWKKLQNTYDAAWKNKHSNLRFFRVFRLLQVNLTFFHDSSQKLTKFDWKSYKR